MQPFLLIQIDHTGRVHLTKSNGGGLDCEAHSFPDLFPPYFQWLIQEAGFPAVAGIAIDNEV
jgi:hypothetical protein